MRRKLLRAVIPAQIRARVHWQLYKHFQKEIIAEEHAKRMAVWEELPKIELQSKHIKDLCVISDRQALLHLMPRNSCVAEVGVAKGDFTRDILSITTPERLNLIDWWAGDEKYEGVDGMMFVEDRFQSEISSGKVSVRRGLSVDVLEEYSDSFFDWVYVDTDHSYETTSKELQICLRKVKDNGIIAGHDYVNMSISGCTKYGVVEAVNEFCVNHDWKMILLTCETHRHLSWALRRIDENESS